MNLNKETINYDIDRMSAIKEAEEKGLKVVYPKDTELLLDIDTEEHMQLFEERAEYLNQFLPIDFEIKQSQSGHPHYHIYVTLEDRKGPLADVERIFLQLFLGSDPTREFLSYLRVLSGEELPTLLLEKNNEKL